MIHRRQDACVAQDSNQGELEDEPDMQIHLRAMPDAVHTSLNRATAPIAAPPHPCKKVKKTDL